MAIIPVSLIWVAYAVAIAILLVIAAIFVYIYQKPGDRAPSVTIVSLITISALLATVLLLPVDVALVSATVRRKDGVRKDWATPDEVDSIVYTLKVVYYTLYSLDALLCLLVVPFTYFYYEEYDERETAEGSQTLGKRIWGAFKYTIMFIAIVIILFLVGFFVPVAKDSKNKHKDLDFFKGLLAERRGERALTFAMGLLITIGTFVYLLYTGAGLALLPVTFIKSAPSISAPSLAADTASQLELNRERQRQLEGRNEGRQGGLDAADRRELEALIREERTLVRRERLASETQGQGSFIRRAWVKTEAVFRPLKLIGGAFLMLVAIIVWVSMFITAVDKAKYSVCKTQCGYILGKINIFQPVNWIFMESAKAFPVDYILYLLLVVFFFSSSIVGIATIGIRFLWLTIFKIRKGHTSPQALLLATVLLALIVLAINYSLAMIVAPQYSTFGTQTYCDRPSRHPGEMPDCTHHQKAIKHCTEKPESDENHAAYRICTPSVVSTFLNRITINFPFFGVVTFWAQFAFLGVYLITAVATLIKTPKLDTDELDQDLEEEEEEGLLATTGRRFNATWQDITGRARKVNPGNSYGATGSNN